MPGTQDTDYYTVAQAAAVLQVSTVTVWRWIKADLLPAYRTGPKNIRIKKADLDCVISPARDNKSKAGDRQEADHLQEPRPLSAAFTIRPMTDDEVQRGLAALEQARASRAQMLAERGGKPLASSAPIIRHAREQRSRHLQ